MVEQTGRCVQEATRHVGLISRVRKMCRLRFVFISWHQADAQCEYALPPPPSPPSVYATTTPKLRKSAEDGAPGVGGLYLSDCEPTTFNPAVK